MSGYTPVFDTVFQGTLCGKYPDLPVWLVLLALQQRGGIIDAHPSYIATISGLPQADIELAIKRFCEPDPASRTPDNDGRRLEPIEGAGFGWRVINHRKYQEKARLTARNARETAERRESPAIPRNPPQTAANRPSDSNKTKQDKEGAGAPRATKRCPEDFVPDREHALREIPDLDYEREAQKFKDWEFKTARKDWPACWRTWIGNARDRGQYAKRGTSGLPKVYGGSV